MLNLDLENANSDLYGILRNADDFETLKWLRASDKNLLKAELYVAERIARLGGKRRTYNTHAVELYLDENLDKLTEQIYNYEYKPSRGVAHIIWKPVMREIFAAPYIDRIVHHLMVDTINPWWDRRLNAGASSCRVGKGTSYGIALLDRHIRQASGNFAVPVYVVKLDISGYFMHINREKLLERVLWGLKRQFRDNYGKRYKMMRYLAEAIIMDDPVKGAKIRGSYEDWRNLPLDKSLFAAAPGCGLVIGNVTSQVFSNIYLDVLDRFVTFELGYKYYGRYVDDFYLVVTESELAQAKRDIRVIDGFLHGLGLSLNLKKTKVIASWQGVPFLGMVNKNGVLMPDKRLSSNYRRAAYSYIAGVQDEASISSYIGMMKNYNSWKVILKAFTQNKSLLNGLMGRVEMKWF